MPFGLALRLLPFLFFLKVFVFMSIKVILPFLSTITMSNGQAGSTLLATKNPCLVSFAIASYSPTVPFIDVFFCLSEIICLSYSKILLFKVIITA